MYNESLLMEVPLLAFIFQTPKGVNRYSITSTVLSLHAAVEREAHTPKIKWWSFIFLRLQQGPKWSNHFISKHVQTERHSKKTKKCNLLPIVEIYVNSTANIKASFKLSHMEGFQT